MLKDSVTIPSEITEIKKVSSRIIKALGDYRLAEEVIFDIRLCTEEALRNAVVHGNKGKKELPVKVSFEANDEAIQIAIEDRGRGFDYKNIPDPTTDENILKTNGRGILLIRKLMDEVHFNDTGNRICMIKYLSLPRSREGGKQ